MSRDTVRLWDLVRGVMAALPDTLRVQKGLWNLVTAAPDRRGSIGQVLAEHAARRPQATALLFEDQRWSYSEFNAWANRIAAVLRAHGVGNGDAVAVLFENRPESLASVAGIVKLGAVAGLLNHQQRGEALAHSIKLTQAKIVVVGEECVAALASTAFTPMTDATRVYLWDGVGKPPNGYLSLRELTATANAENPVETVAVLQKQPAFFIFTSGTTGLPKASVMTHYRWLRGMAGVGQMALRLKPDDILYCPLPLYHNNALTVSWGATLGSGCALALGRKFSASRFWDEIRRTDATAFCYIGELCRYLLNQAESGSDREHRVRMMVGNGLRPELWDAFQARFGIARICEFYGASESNAAFINAFGVPRTAGFCPLPFAIVKFDADLDQPRRLENGHLQKVTKGGIGLLITEVGKRTPFDGYTDAKASEAKLLRNVFKSGDVWFNTGDLVRNQGWRHIQFADRVGDTFRWKGENVATTEVEAALASFPGVLDAVVYGVLVQHADGRAGMAALTLSDALDGAALAQHLAAQLPAYAVPLFLRLRAEQETTSTFKFRKVELKREGFDPALVHEPLYLLADRRHGYQRLTAKLHAQIVAGELRL